MRRQLSFLVCLAAACIIAAYSPPPEVVYMHEKIPRPDAMHGMALTTNTFGPDLLGEPETITTGEVHLVVYYYYSPVSKSIIALEILFHYHNGLEPRRHALR